jgi:hypothetical protein
MTGWEYWEGAEISSSSMGPGGVYDVSELTELRHRLNIVHQFGHRLSVTSLGR